MIRALSEANKIQEAIMRVFLKILKVLAIISVIFFGVTFTVYIFNLDMKLTAAIEPILLKHYDKIERDQHL